MVYMDPWKIRQAIVVEMVYQVTKRIAEAQLQLFSREQFLNEPYTIVVGAQDLVLLATNHRPLNFLVAQAAPGTRDGRG